MNPAPYSAYCNFGDYRILSSSPERMFLKEGNRITTGPIKGTIARGSNEEEDMVNTERLLRSEKDRAELLMIVDLARNDLGRIAEIGSVSVDSLFRPEIYSSVIHLVGDVSCRLAPKTGTTDVLRALMPGGSITGAPKRRAIEIIDSLEDTPRSVYTGCIGYVVGDRADFNIAIRTMLYRNGRYHIHAGGGIVADSEPGAEFEEMRLKARNMLSAVGLPPERIRWPK
jgi:para-aminobenzoate synthetase component 1